MAVTYKKIASVTVGSGGAADIEFTSIPSTHTDLVLQVSARASAATVYPSIYLRCNAQTGSGTYTYRVLYGDGSSATSGTDITGTSSIYFGTATGSLATANTFSNGQIYIPNYTSSSTYKSISIDNVGESNQTQTYQTLTAALYNQNTAISSLQIYADSSFVQYTTATLYGISKS